MTYRNHMLINLSAALWLNASLENTGVLVLSSVFPDLIDYYTLNEYTWWEEHRGLSHFWALYIAGYIAGTTLLPPQSLEHFLYLITGCLLHIFMDFLTPMGIPVLTPSRRRSIFLFKTGSFKETFFTLCVFSLSVYLKGRMWLETQFPGLI